MLHHITVTRNVIVNKHIKQSLLLHVTLLHGICYIIEEFNHH